MGMEWQAMTDTIPEWALTRARKIIADMLRRDGFVDADIDDVLSGKTDAQNGIDIIARALTDVEAETAERERELAAQKADKWNEISDQQIRLMAGELTAQEIRTAKAVASGIATAIRSLPAKYGEKT